MGERVCCCWSYPDVTACSVADGRRRAGRELEAKPHASASISDDDVLMRLAVALEVPIFPFGWPLQYAAGRGAKGLSAGVKAGQSRRRQNMSVTARWASTRYDMIVPGRRTERPAYGPRWRQSFSGPLACTGHRSQPVSPGRGRVELPIPRLSSRR